MGGCTCELKGFKSGNPEGWGLAKVEVHPKGLTAGMDELVADRAPPDIDGEGRTFVEVGKKPTLRRDVDLDV